MRLFNTCIGKNDKKKVVNDILPRNIPQIIKKQNDSRKRNVFFVIVRFITIFVVQN